MGFLALILLCSFGFVAMDHLFRRYIHNRDKKNQENNQAV